MSSIHTAYIVNNISLPFDASFKEAFSVARKRLSSIGVRCDDVSFSVYRRSTDARRKSDIRFVYSIRVSGELPRISEHKLVANGIAVEQTVTPTVEFGQEKNNAPIVVVGTGPCGIFCALMLAENGFKPILLERGGSVGERQGVIKSFARTRILDPNTNIQFGAGGAGTFSDGKLVTRINDPLSNYILKKLVELGAPEDVLYIAKPHVGTDILAVVVQRALDKISALGGKVLYHTEFTGYESSLGRVTRVKTSNGDIECSDLVLAIGHSARDTYRRLISQGLTFEAKPFSVGMRIEHRAELIDKALYGDFAGNPILGHAEYNLSYNTKQRGVYTFCMCPGGVVVAATSEEGGVVSNGMSYYARDGVNSNSAVCCSIFKEDYGSTPIAAIEFQQKIERAAFVAGGSDYSAPIITVGDFLSRRLSSSPTEVIPTYMDGKGVRIASAEDYLPTFVTDNIRASLIDFDKKINGFASSTAVLTGAETRTSSPVRITRDSQYGTAIGFTNLYPAGEGAGYAGGITSAAIDGVRTALGIMKKYRP